MKPVFLSAAALLISACDATLQPNDTTPPTISVFTPYTPGKLAFISSNPEVDLGKVACPEGQEPTGPLAIGPFFPSGVDPAEVTLVFSDKSGIRSFEIAVGDPGLINLPTVRKQGTSVTGRPIVFYSYEVIRTADFKTVESVAAEFRIMGNNQIVYLPIDATDQAGNSERLWLYLISADDVCRTRQ
jgi:hypothetical protein